MLLTYIEDRRPSYEDTYLDYIAFCDVNDGNFVAIVTQGEQLGKVFFLDHEYAYYPFREQKEGYPIVAETFESWLSLVRDTKGWDAVGYADMHV